MDFLLIFWYPQVSRKTVSKILTYNLDNTMGVGGGRGEGGNYGMCWRGWDRVADQLCTCIPYFLMKVIFQGTCFTPRPYFVGFTWYVVVLLEEAFSKLFD